MPEVGSGESVYFDSPPGTHTFLPGVPGLVAPILLPLAPF
jgi:hypothetical protein